MGRGRRIVRIRGKVAVNPHRFAARGVKERWQLAEDAAAEGEGIPKHPVDIAIAAKLGRVRQIGIHQFPYMIIINAEETGRIIDVLEMQGAGNQDWLCVLIIWVTGIHQDQCRNPDFVFGCRVLIIGHEKGILALGQGAAHHRGHHQADHGFQLAGDRDGAGKGSVEVRGQLNRLVWGTTLPGHIGLVIKSLHLHLQARHGLIVDAAHNPRQGDRCGLGR